MVINLFFFLLLLFVKPAVVYSEATCQVWNVLSNIMMTLVLGFVVSGNILVPAPEYMLFCRPGTTALDTSYWALLV